MRIRDAVTVIVGGLLPAWLYLVVPGYKAELEGLGIGLDERTTWVFELSDALVNFWYMTVIPLAALY